MGMIVLIYSSIDMMDSMFPVYLTTWLQFYRLTPNDTMRQALQTFQQPFWVNSKLFFLSWIIWKSCSLSLTATKQTNPPPKNSHLEYCGTLWKSHVLHHPFFFPPNTHSHWHLSVPQQLIGFHRVSFSVAEGHVRWHVPRGSWTPVF